MASKVFTISLPVALKWKLDQLNKRTGIPRSALIQRALLLLIGDFLAINFPGGQVGHDFYLEDIEKEYAEREVEDDSTS